MTHMYCTFNPTTQVRNIYARRPNSAYTNRFCTPNYKNSRPCLVIFFRPAIHRMVRTCAEHPSNVDNVQTGNLRCKCNPSCLRVFFGKCQTADHRSTCGHGTRTCNIYYPRINRAILVSTIRYTTLLWSKSWISRHNSLHLLYRFLGKSRHGARWFCNVRRLCICRLLSNLSSAYTTCRCQRSGHIFWICNDGD